MNELELYVDSLDPNLSNEEKVRLVKKWKKDNNWGENQVEVSEQVELEEVDLGTVKKKDGVPGAVAPSMGPQEAPQPVTEFGLEDTFSVSPAPEIKYNIDGKEVSKEEFDSYSKQKEKEREASEMSFLDRLGLSFELGTVDLGKMAASIPETLYDIASIPQNLAADPDSYPVALRPYMEALKAKGYLDFETSSKSFKEETGVSNPILDYYEEESKQLQGIADIYDNENYDSKSIYENFKKGNYSDGFRLLAQGITRSTPVSLSMMAGGAVTTTGKLAAGSTIGFAGPEISEELTSKPGQSELLSIMNGLGMGAAEGVWESVGISTLGKIYKDIISKEGLDAGSKIFKDGIIDMYRAALVKYGAPVAMVEGGVQEVGTKITQNMIKGLPAFEGVNDAFIQGVGASGVYSSPINISKAGSFIKQGITNNKINKELQNTEFNEAYEAFNPEFPTTKFEIKASQIPGSLEVIDKEVDAKVRANDITNEQGDNIKNRAREVQGAVNQLKPLDISVQNQPAIVDLMIEQKNLKNTIKQVDNSSLTKAESERLVEIDKKLNDIIVADRISKIEKSTARKGAKIAAEQLDAGFESFPTQQDMDSAAEGLREDGWDVQDSTGYGMALTKGDQKIILINDQAAGEDNVYTTDQHEVLHPFWESALKANPEAAITLGKALIAEIVNNKDITGGFQFMSRFQDYLIDEKYSAQNTWEEVIPLVSEALSNGDIQYNPKKEAWWKNLGTKITNFLKGNKKPLNLEFNTGKDVFDFIRGYNETIEAGKGLTEQQLEVAKKGAKGKLIEGELDIEGLGAEFVEAFEGDMRDETAQDIAKESKRIEDSQEVQKIYDDQGVAGAMDIIQKFKPITSRIVESRSQAPNFDRQLLTDEIETGPRGILDLIMDYPKYVKEQQQKKEKVAPLAGFINNMLPKRAIEASRRVLGEEFTTDVTEAKGVIAKEEVEVETKEKPLAKKPTETVEFSQAQVEKISAKDKAEVEARITEATNEAFKGQDIKTFGQTRNVPKSVADIYAGMFGLNPQTITDKTRNYQKTDAEGLTTAKQFLLKNANNDFARLPETKDGFGKGTFLPRNVMNALYTDGKLTGTLKDYMDLIRQKPTKPIYRDAVGQTIRGLLNLHIRNRMFEDLVTTTPERLRGGAKFSKRIKQALSKEAIPEEVKGIKANIQKIIAEATPGDLGAFDLSTLESRQEAVRFMENEFFPKLFEVFGIDARVLLKSKELAPSGNNVISYKPGKKVRKIGGALGRDQLGITDVNRASKEIELNKELAEAGLVYQVKNILKEFNSLDLKGKKSEAIETALKTQVTKDAESNLKTRELHKKGYKDFLNLFKKLYDSDPKMMRGIGFLMYNPGANFAFYRNLAQIIGVQEGVKKGREEHVYQAGNWARRTLEAMSSKNGEVWKNWLDWSAENYYQEAIEGKDKGKESSEYVVDAIYKKDRYSDPSDRPYWMPETSNITYESQSMEHPLLKSALDKAMKTGDFSKVPDPKIRYYNDYFSLNPNLLGNKGVTDAEKYNVEVPKDFVLNSEVYKYQGELIYGQILTEAGILTGSDAITKSKARQMLDNYLKTAKLKSEAAVINNNLQPNNIKLEGNNAKSSKRVIDELGNLDTALNQARRPDAPVKKIRVFDFDDTLARSKSMVIANMPDGSSRKINATEFAAEAANLEEQGAEFDFSEFSKVIDGKKGPLFSVAEKIAKARGTDDIFILTARPANAAGPIQAFMKANGIDIPLQNITGLGDGTAAAKGRWIAGKAAEGYNDFYFADDAVKNVQAVKDVLSQVDVKSKVQQAKASKRIVFDKVFNDIIEAKTGIESYKDYSAAKAKTVGSSKGKFTFFTTPSAEDFVGLLYKTLGKGKVGDAQMAFYKENLLDPFNRAEMAISQAKVAAGRDYKALKKQFKSIPKTLEKETGIAKYTYQHAIRTYIWDSQGLEVPGLSKRDQKRLTDFVKADQELQAFADQLVNIQKGKPYPKPDKDWTAGNITTDVISGINKVNRAEYLQEWQENVDIIFSEKNMNKLEAAFGAKYVEALKDSLRAMKSGSNRPLGGDRVSNQILDWLNNSVGAIMFLNTRSAVLQTISAVNFINWGDNNILKAGKAFANQKQFWGDFLTLMNSDYLLERRDGLKINVSESEIADAVEGSKNKVNAAISYLLNKGFVFTRYADSFAIASGGATFYRNRIESLVEQGVDRKLAEQQAFEDFRLIAEENQQSSSPMRISQQQRSLIGRIVLQFGNTQLQYVRIQKRAVQDLVNGRGDWRANISKIVYYGAIQNIMFNALQSGLAWALFDEDEDDEQLTEANKEQKLERALNGAIDSQLKGLGIQGAVIAGVKNALMTIAEQADKKSPKFEEALDDLLSIAPALGSKIRKLKSAARTVSWNRKEIKEKGFDLDNPAYLAGAQTISAVFNIPLDRAVMKMNNLRNVLNPATENWQKVALALGWSGWDVGLPYFGLAEDKPVLTETEKQTKKLFDLNKSDQVKMLLDLGLTKKEIRALTKEEQRVDQIIKLQNKKKDGK